MTRAGISTHIMQVHRAYQNEIFHKYLYCSLERTKDTNTSVAYQSSIYNGLEYARYGGVVERICRGVVGYILGRIDKCVEQLLERCPYMDSAKEGKQRGRHNENPIMERYRWCHAIRLG